MRQHVSGAWTIAITAAGFALIHGYPPLMLLAFVLGLVSGWVRERSGSVIPTVFAHVSHNVAMVAFAYATTGWTARLPAWGQG
jgi:membrane protease YdiL (CAAX protease family)